MSDELRDELERVFQAMNPEHTQLSDFVDAARPVVARRVAEVTKELQTKLDSVECVLQRAFDHGNGLDVFQVEVLLSTLVAAPVEPGWEYGVMFPEIRKKASFVGIEDSARYFMGRPANSLDKYARDDDKRVLVRRVPAGPWIPVEGTRGGDGA